MASISKHPAPQPPRRTRRVDSGEALAVLSEMHRLAEERLLEASAAFQDIAFEMEWRLTEWHRLIRERDQVQKLLTEKRRACNRFNQSAHQRGSKLRSQLALWQKQVNALARRQRQHQQKFLALTNTIKARNAEGDELLQEIYGLHERCLRIERSIKRLKGDRTPPNHSGETLLRLASSLADVSDAADPYTLLTAADTVLSRLNGTTSR